MKRFGFAVLALGLVCGLGMAGGGTTVELDGLKAKAPADWKKQETSNKFRVYQFALPHNAADKEDAELVIFHFEGGGGSVKDNLARWKGFFTGADGRPVDDKAKV